jgi:hypothetical protein
MSDAVRAAHDRLTAAVLRSIAAARTLETDPHADADAQCQYADEQVALAARALVDATNRLEPHEQPVGWSQSPGPAPRPEHAHPSSSSKSA